MNVRLKFFIFIEFKKFLIILKVFLLSFSVNDPQKTPTIEHPFNKGRFSGNLGIVPAAKPTTKYLPFHFISLTTISESSPPTGSYITSTPCPWVNSFTFFLISSFL